MGGNEQNLVRCSRLGFSTLHLRHRMQHQGKQGTLLPSPGPFIHIAIS